MVPQLLTLMVALLGLGPSTALVRAPLLHGATRARLATVAQAAPEMIRLVASDVDGTLLDSDSALSPRSEATLVDLLDRERGWLFVPATGKCRAGALAALGPRLAERLRRGPGVFNQGLQVFGRSGELVYEQTLPPDVVAEVERQSAGLDVSLVGYCGDDLFTTVSDARTVELNTKYFEPLPQVVATALATTASERSMHKLLVLATPDTLAELRPAVAAALGNRAALTQALPTILEVLPSGCSKGNGLIKLLESVAVEPAHCVAFGDAENDVEMLQLVGLGCSVANGLPSVKAAADVVIPANDDEGVPRVLEALLALAPKGGTTDVASFRAALAEAGLLLP